MPAPPHAGMLRPRQVLALLACSLFAAGLAGESTPGPWLLFASTLLFHGLQSFLPFYWYRLDSDRHAFARSRWMNFGVIFVSPLALPIYLLRTRPCGRRLRAVLRLVAYLLLLMLVTGLGMFLGSKLY